VLFRTLLGCAVGGTKSDVATNDPKDTLTELIALVKGSAKQETVDPLRRLGRYLGFGIAGALLMTIGVFFLAMAGLRYLQTHRFFKQHLTGGWSWLPYLIVMAGLFLVAGLFASRINNKDDHG
jgi:hypothetical protein